MTLTLYTLLIIIIRHLAEKKMQKYAQKNIFEKIFLTKIFLEKIFFFSIVGPNALKWL